MPTPQIVFSDVSHAFEARAGGKVAALRGIDVSVAADQFVAIVGPSGCGKSTLLRLAAGLIRPTDGVVQVDGRPVTEPSGDIGFVFQSPNLLPWANVLENVLFPLKIMRRLDASGVETARGLLQLAGLAEFEKKMPSELSGGMQQRAAI